LLLREKIKLAAPGEFTGRACFSALKEVRRQLFSLDQRGPRNRVSLAHVANPQAPDRQALDRQTFDPQAYSPELHGLLGSLKAIRQRILANSLLRSGAGWFVWLLLGLVAVGLVIDNFAGGALTLAVLAAVGAVALLAWTWRNRPSDYEAARRLDSAAGLQDRISTAVYLGGIDDPQGMAGEQRKDALARFAKLDPRRFFPVEAPGNLRRAAALLLVVTGLFAYRIHHRPPLVSLLQTTARSALVQSILSPIAHAMEKDLQRMAAVAKKQDAPGNETERAESTSNSEALWKSDDKGPGAEDPKDSADAGAGDQPQDQMQAPGNPEGDPSGEARQQDSYSPSQEGKSGDDSSTGKGQQSEQQGPEGRQSLGQSLLQALKNMMSNSPSQQSNNRAAQQPPNGQGNPQSGNSQQPGGTESDKRGDSRGNSDAKQKATQTASEGAGSQQGSKELRKDQESHPVNAVPDRVALEAGGYKEQTRMKIATETGAAQLADRGLAPRQDAVINGAEQENIPARYRFYVQRYFEHADNEKH
jgi:hypothetical protein